MMWTLAAETTSEPSTTMTVVALLVFLFAVVGLLGFLRRCRNFLTSLAKANAEARASSRSDAEADADARAAAAVDLGGVHFHGDGGGSRATGVDHYDRTVAYDLDHERTRTVDHDDRTAYDHDDDGPGGRSARALRAGSLGGGPPHGASADRLVLGDRRGPRGEVVEVTGDVQ